MSGLSKISDDVRSRTTAWRLALEAAPAVPWALLFMAIDNNLPGSMAGGLFLSLLNGVLKHPWPIGPRRDRVASPAPGVWLTSPTRRLRRLVALVLPLAGLGCALGMASASFQAGDALALMLDVLIVLGFSANLAWDAWRGLPVRLEVRIDDDGLYSCALGGVLGFDKILAVLPRPRGEKFKLRLRVGPGAPGLPSYLRHRDGEVTVDLSAACLTHDMAVDALRAAYPDLCVHLDATSSDSRFVVPIRGVDDEENRVPAWEEMDEQRRRFGNETYAPYVSEDGPAYRPTVLESIGDEEPGRATDG